MLRICKWAYYAKKRHMFTSRKQEIYSVRSQNLLSGKRGEEKLFSFLHPTLFFWQRKERKKVKYQERAKGHFFLLFSLKLPKRRQITDSLSFLSLPRTIIIIFQRGGISGRRLLLYNIRKTSCKVQFTWYTAPCRKFLSPCIKMDDACRIICLPFAIRILLKVGHTCVNTVDPAVVGHKKHILALKRRGRR